jgi:hypothetical protein
MLMSDKIATRGLDAAGEFAQRVLAGVGEVHRICPLLHLAAETLAM